MRKLNQTKPLKHSEISKRIISKQPEARSPEELFDEFGKYRDEHVAVYNDKKKAFLDAAKKYNKLNNETVMSQKVRLHNDYEGLLDLDFLKDKEYIEEEECSGFCCCERCKPNLTGRLLKKRSSRPMHFEEAKSNDLCLMEPWFRRYLTLNKFIWAGRTIILQNRLLKVLAQLKKMNRKTVLEIEKKTKEGGFKKKCSDYHCDEVFEKFL